MYKRQVKICSHKGNVFAVEPPLFVELEITETEPGFKGDTATGATKPVSYTHLDVYKRQSASIAKRLC